MILPTIADVCCAAGLIADGYASVGFQPEGYDLFSQPLYPYRFEQADALDWLASSEPKHYPVIHTSFPCQFATRGKHLRDAQGGTSRFDDLLTPGLELLRTRWNDRPWVAENVEDTETKRIMEPREGEHLILLCGSTFGLKVKRHRLFLSNVPLRQPTRPERRPHPTIPDRTIPPTDSARLYGCRHEAPDSPWDLDPRTGKPRPWGVWHVKGDNVPKGGRTALDAEHARQVMGSHRLLPWDSIKEGVPPQYGAFVGADLLQALR